MLLRSFLARGFLRDPLPPIVPGGGGAPVPAPAPTPAPAPAPAPAQPFAVFPNQAAFEERVAREARQLLRTQVGVEDPAEVQRRLARLQELETADAERQRQTLTEQQRLQQDLETARAAAESAASERDEERFRSHVLGICARTGIRNVAYAQFIVAEAAEALPEGQQLDAEAHLRGLLEDAQARAALGIVADPSVVPTPVSTSPVPGSPEPAPPRSPAPPGAVDAMSMTPAQFQAHLATMGASG